MAERARDLEQAGAAVAQRTGERAQLVFVGERAGNRRAVLGPVRGQPVRAHRERAGLDGLAREATHGGHVVGRRHAAA